MKLIYLLLFVSLNAFASSGSGNVSNVFNGGGASADSAIAGSNGPSFALPLSDFNSTNIVALICGTNSVTATNYYGCYSMSGPTASGHYQVPPGKQLYVLSIRVRSGTACSGCVAGLGTATADFTENNSSVPTGAIPYGGSDAAPSLLSSSVTAGQAVDYSFPMYFKSGAWIYVKPTTWGAAATLSVVITGYLK